MLANLEGGNHEKARSRFDASLPAPAATAAPNAYITNQGGGVSVIDTATNTVITTIPVGQYPKPVAVSSDGRNVYVANTGCSLIENSYAYTVSVIDTATNTVIATIPNLSAPSAFGIFIQPPPRFAGVPGSANCHGKSVSALATKFGGLPAAAAALGFASVQALQDAITAFCQAPGTTARAAGQ
jgi:YVTN family beta-propeller protein